MWLYPTQQLSSNSSSLVLASPGSPSWGGRQSCRIEDRLWVPLLPLQSLPFRLQVAQIRPSPCFAPRVLRQPETVLDALRDWTRRTHRHTQAPTGMGTVRG